MIYIDIVCIPWDRNLFTCSDKFTNLVCCPNNLCDTSDRCHSLESQQGIVPQVFSVLSTMTVLFTIIFVFLLMRVNTIER
jgi:hypothetical protein